MHFQNTFQDHAPFKSNHLITQQSYKTVTYVLHCKVSFTKRCFTTAEVLKEN